MCTRVDIAQASGIDPTAPDPQRRRRPHSPGGDDQLGAYARNAQVVLPPLDNYEKAQQGKKIVPANFEVA
jgi:hypothetical protein